jgi:hypothetical protein
MTALARKFSLSQDTGLTLSIAASAARITFNVQLAEPLGNEHFAIDITVAEAPVPLEVPKPRECDGEPRKPERDAESDAYGENGERMPYHPPRPREVRSGELAYGAFDRAARGPVS